MNSIVGCDRNEWNEKKNYYQKQKQDSKKIVFEKNKIKRLIHCQNEDADAWTRRHPRTCWEKIGAADRSRPERSI